MIKWVVCDLDGTLFKHNENMLVANPQTIELINKLKQDNNVIFTFATGRHYLNAINLLKNSKLNFDENDFVVGLNGSQIYHMKKDALIFKELIKNEALLKLNNFINEQLEKAYPNQYLIIFYGQNNDIIFLKNNSSNYQALIKDVIDFHGQDDCFKTNEVDNIKDAGDVYKCTIYIKDKNFDYPSLKNELNKLTNKQFEIAKSSTYLLEIMPFNINKSNALDCINQNYYNIDKNAILAFGDSLNDYEMFKFAKTSVTRNGADENLKKIASYVIDAEPSDFVLDGLELLVG